MSVEKCLSDKVLAGKITREQADAALKVIKDYEGELAARLGPDTARVEAIALAAKRVVEDAKRSERNAALQIVAQDRALKWATEHKKGVAAGVAAVFARDIHGLAGHGSVEARQQAYRKMLEGVWAAGIDAYAPRVGGLSRDVAGMRNLIRENYQPGGSGDAVAAAAAKAWKETTDYAAEAWIESGGKLSQREVWRQPQPQSPLKVKGLGQEKYEQLMNEAISNGWLKIVDWETGDLVSPGRAQEIVRNAYRRISTNGLSDLEPGQQKHIKIADSRMERRAFQWTSADAWLWANETFGLGDAHIFDLFASHLDSMGRDIGLIQILGPDPDATARVLIDTARKEIGDGWKVYNLESIYDQVTGKAYSPVSAVFAHAARETRAFLASAQLGSALLATPGDFVSMSASGAWLGLPQTKLISEYVAGFNPASKADRLHAARAGFIAESYTMRVSGAVRDQMDNYGTGLFSRVADTVLRLSLLTAHTDAAKQAFARTAMGHLADLSGRGYERLPKEMKRFFDAHGITETDWNAMRAHGVVDYDGVKFMEPMALAKHPDRSVREAGLKIEGALLEEMNMAVPTPGARERSVIIGRTQPGTIAGEAMRTFGQYKGFPMAIMLGHGARAVSELQNGRGAYLASMAFGLTLAGALSIQLKSIAQGKDPRKMSDAKFWGAAFVQGGGAGIMGDFLYAGLSRSDQGVVGTFFAGPAGGLADDIVRLTIGNIGQAAEGEKTDIGAEAARFLRRNTPGTSLWYARLGMDRLIWDNLQKELDPEYARRFARMEKRTRKEYGQEYWWRPGASSPSRGPDLSAR